jgi:hypothetical protein
MTLSHDIWIVMTLLSHLSLLVMQCDIWKLCIQKKIFCNDTSFYFLLIL